MQLVDPERREGLENDYLRLLDERGLQRPVFRAPDDLDTPEGREIAALASPDVVERVRQKMRSDPSGYQHIVAGLVGGMIPEAILDSVYFGEFPTGTFNAQTRRTSNGYLCLLNRGLRELLYAMALAAHYTLDENLTVIEGDVRRDLERHIQAAGACWNYVRGRGGRIRYAGQQHNPKALEFGIRSFGAMRDFVVAHEAAHVLLGHLTDAPVRMILEEARPLEVLEKSRQQELEADAFAQELLLECVQYGGPIEATGALCFLQVHRILTTFQVEVVGTDPPRSDSHPTAEERFEAVFAHLKATLTDAQLSFVVNATSLYERLRMGIAFASITPQGIRIDWEGFQKQLDGLRRHGA